jgi:hypothetical protein
MTGESRTTIVLISILIFLAFTAKGETGKNWILEQLQESPFRFGLVLALVSAFLVGAFLHATGQIDIIKLFL